MLDEERQYYQENQAEWLKQYAGRIVLVKGRQLIGVFNTPDEAMAEGARRFGLTNFLVRRVDAAEEEIRIPALTLGLLRGHTPHPTSR
jgi:hypothetical protein